MLNRIKNFLKKKEEAPIKRTLSVIYAHTFPTGEKLYTYKYEDFGKISSRYWRGIQDQIKHLHTFNMLPLQWDKAIDECLDICASAVRKKNNTEEIMQIHNSLVWFKQKKKGTKTSAESYLEFLFCMFYLLEDEVETGYSPIHNEKKIKLLNDNLEMRDFFLSNLKENCKDLLPQSREDILKYLIQTESLLNKTMKKV